LGINPAAPAESARRAFEALSSAEINHHRQQRTAQPELPDRHEPIHPRERNVEQHGVKVTAALGQLNAFAGVGAWMMSKSFPDAFNAELIPSRTGVIIDDE